MVEKSEIQTALAAFKEKRDRLNIVIAELESLLGGPGESNIPIDTSEIPTVNGIIDRGSGSNEIRSDEFFQMTIPAAAKKYLQMVKHPVDTGEITKALKDGGTLTQAKNFYLSVHSSMTRDNTFIRVKKNWGLAEWYPNRPKPIVSTPKSKRVRVKIKKAKPTAVKKTAEPQSPD